MRTCHLPLLATLLFVHCGPRVEQTPRAPFRRSAADASARPTSAPQSSSRALLPALRLLSPPSGAYVTARTPTLRWTAPADRGAARVELCRDRDCARPVATLEAAGTEARPRAPLERGPVFWRVRTSSGVTATWSFTVPPRDAPIVSALRAVNDVNGDGFSDVLLADFPQRAGLAQLRGGVRLYLGGPGGLASRSAIERTAGPRANNVSEDRAAAIVGDLDGDGRSEVLLGAPCQPALDRPYPAGRCGPGRVLIFQGTADGLTSTPTAVLTGHDGVEYRFGQRVLSVGDVDGDGRADVAIAFGGSAACADRLRVYPSSAGGLTNTAPITLMLPAGTCATRASDSIAEGLVATTAPAIASAGDVNGDGYGDVVAGGACADDATEPCRGGVQLYLGGPHGLPPAPSAVFAWREGLHEGFGAALDGVGDVDGDGYADIVVGAVLPAADEPGAVYLLRGDPAGLQGTPVLLEPLADTGALSLRLRHPLRLDTTSAAGAVDGERSTLPAAFGSRVVGLGDLDGDGRWDVGLAGRAQLAMVLRSSAPAEPDILAEGSGPPVDDFGSLFIPLGDVDGDGYADVLIGSSCAQTDHRSGDNCVRPLVHVYRGGPGPITAVRHSARTL